MDTNTQCSQADDVSGLMMKAAHIAYLDFIRRLRWGANVSMEDRSMLTGRVKQLLVRRLPELLTAHSQAEFDRKHRALCLEILHIYEPVSPQHHGIAQRWVNQTLMELLAIVPSLSPGNLPVARTRQFFHVPADQGWVLKVATAHRKDRFRHGLGLKAAPLKHDPSGSYEMGWYQLGKSQPFADWGYPEYMAFQRAVRVALAGPIRDGKYKDVADWALQAGAEVKHNRNNLRIVEG